METELATCTDIKVGITYPVLLVMHEDLLQRDQGVVLFRSCLVHFSAMAR